MCWFEFGWFSSLRPHLQPDSLIGKSVTVVLNSVSDLYGNYLMMPVTWSFTIADFGPESATAYIVGARLSTPIATFRAKTGELKDIQTQLAAYFGVAPSRIFDVNAFRTPDSLTALTFIIRPPSSTADTKTATILASKFSKDASNASSAASPFASYSSLAPIINSTVCHSPFSCWSDYHVSSLGACEHLLASHPNPLDIGYQVMYVDLASVLVSCFESCCVT